MILLRINALIQGYSGTRLETLELMISFLDKNIIPVVFEKGSLGASGAMKSSVVTIVEKVAPTHAENNAYYSKFIKEDKSPMNSWLVFQSLGILFGAFISGSLSGRIRWRVQHSPKITSRRRLVFALAGGILFGLGAQIARGCTSGAALSGMAVLSSGGFITMLAIFGTGYIVAYFFRKNFTRLRVQPETFC
mgnify:CR=1 FL=1